VVIDRPKTDFLVLAENEYSARNAAEYSADNENSAQGSKSGKNVNVKIFFLGRLQLRIAVDRQDLWATKTNSA
jgi:hypothetical protein